MMRILGALVALAHAKDIPLVTFDGAAATSHAWKEMNDPVMGGKSTGTFSITGGVGVFDGEVVDVPFLKAPGFIKADTSDGTQLHFPDVSSCAGIEITAKASSSYAGYRFSFGNAHAPHGKVYAYGYKSHFTPVVGDFGSVTLPFDSFTDYWDDATGNPIKTCQDDKVYCPDEKTLKSMGTVSVWAEGVKGKVHLEIKQIQAVGCEEPLVV